MLQEILKEATKGDHDTLERLMHVHEIMNGMLNLKQYKQILATNYIVHQHFEDQLTNGLCPDLSKQLNIEQRQKLKALEADLEEVNMVVEDAEPVNRFKLDKSDACALGALYVLEGATLGGNVIVKKLKVNPNLAGLNLNFHYYQVYGDNLITNWKKFCEILNRQPVSTYDASVKSAKKMFEYIAAVQQLQLE